jgi:hypothetical protein
MGPTDPGAKGWLASEFEIWMRSPNSLSLSAAVRGSLHCRLDSSFLLRGRERVRRQPSEEIEFLAHIVHDQNLPIDTHSRYLIAAWSFTCSESSRNNPHPLEFSSSVSFFQYRSYKHSRSVCLSVCLFLSQFNFFYITLLSRFPFSSSIAQEETQKLFISSFETVQLKLIPAPWPQPW